MNEYNEVVYKVPVKGLQIHPVAEATPIMKEEQYQALKLSIEERGQELPGIMYRGRIVDGRHRLRALTELGESTMKVTKLNQNTTVDELQTLVGAVETGRHQTPSQLAVYAYKEYCKGTYNTLVEAAKAKGISTKQVSRAKQVAERHGRLDIIDGIHEGIGFNIGNSYKPLITDSLSSILNYLDTTKSIAQADITGIKPRVELSETEEILLGQMLVRIKTESKMFQAEFTNRLYASKDNHE